MVKTRVFMIRDAYAIKSRICDKCANMRNKFPRVKMHHHSNHDQLHTNCFGHCKCHNLSSLN